MKQPRHATSVHESVHLASFLQQPSQDDGYTSEGSVKSTSKPERSLLKFNSKIYAQKQLENMIEARQTTMDKVYAKP